MMNPILLSLSAALCSFGLTAFGACAPTGTMPVPADTVSEATISADAATPEPTATADTVPVVPAQMPADTVADAGATESSAAREKMEALKEQAKELTEDVKEDLKEGWQEATESFKEQGTEFWNKLKEKAQEWKEEASDFFETHVKSQVVGQFSDNRRQCNQDFCRHLLQDFSSYKIQTFAPELPEVPKRKTGPDTTIYPALTFIEPLAIRHLSAAPQPAQPDIPENELIQSNRIKLQSDGIVLNLDVEPRLNTYGIGKPTEKNLAAFWQKLSESRFDIPLRQLYDAAQAHHLNDWGFYRLIQTASAAIYPKNKNGEQTVWTVFMLNQAGYAAKIGRMGTDAKTYRLLVLLPFYEKVYGCPYVEIGGAPYYIMEKLAGKQRNEPVQSYEGCFALATVPLSLQCPHTLALPCLYEKNDRFAYNLRMMEFYKDYPCVSTSLYLHTPCCAVLDKSIRHKCGPTVDSLLHPVVPTTVATDSLNGCSGESPDNALALMPTDAEPSLADSLAVLDYLGRFVSGYFNDNAKRKLKTEGQPLFPDEAYALKAGDDKDRAIQCARLIKRFLGWDVLLAEYDNTALVGIALPQAPAPDGYAMAAIRGEKCTYYLFNPNAKDGFFWQFPSPLRNLQPIVVL